MPLYRFAVVGYFSLNVPSRPPNIFQTRIGEAIKKALNKLKDADEDCRQLFEHLGVRVEGLGDALNDLDPENQFRDGEHSQDNLWTVMGGEVAGTDSTTTVADLFRMGDPPWPSNRPIDGLSAPNGIIYLRPMAISWENILHETLHQFGGWFSKDHNLLARLNIWYPTIDPEGASSQISDIIKEKCN